MTYRRVRNFIRKLWNLIIKIIVTLRVVLLISLIAASFIFLQHLVDMCLNLLDKRCFHIFIKICVFLAKFLCHFLGAVVLKDDEVFLLSVANFNGYGEEFFSSLGHFSLKSVFIHVEVSQFLRTVL